MSHFGVYIHYPWCRSLCSYCDFPVAIAKGAPPHDAYYRAIVSELAYRAPQFCGRSLVSIYFGGGTPSLWPPSILEQCIAEVTARFEAHPKEITLETNPIDCRPETLAAWRRAGITRLSVGIQSFANTDLITLGRDHQMGDGLRALANAITAGFTTISTDFIVAVPGQRTRNTLTQLDRAIEAGTDHLSIYELTLEPGTRLGQAAARGEFTPVAGDKFAETFEAIDTHLGSRGFEHYEVSSFARPHHRALHNSLYWEGAEYLGLGCGAASFRLTETGGERWTNHRSAKRYLGALPATHQAYHRALSPTELAQDRLWLGLRTDRGVDRECFTHHEGLLRSLLEGGFATKRDHRICPTRRGLLCADEIARRILSNGT